MLTFTMIPEDWMKGHWIFICLGSLLTNNTTHTNVRINECGNWEVRNQFKKHDRMGLVATKPVIGEGVHIRADWLAPLLFA